jgi:hypothetical protein
MLRADLAEISDTFERIGQHVLDAAIRPLDPSSRAVIDDALAAALKEMPKLLTLTIIYDPLDTRNHFPIRNVLCQLRALKHITLAEPPRTDWPHGWPIRLGLQEPAKQQEEEEEEEAMESSESGLDTDTDTDTAQIGTQIETQIETAGLFGATATKNFHSFRKSCLSTLLQHHVERLVSVSLHGSVPLDEHNYRRLRDKAINLKVLQLVGGFESCEPGLVAAVAEDTQWACSGKLHHLTIRGTGTSTKFITSQFKLGVFGDALDEPPSASSGYPSYGTRRA